MPTRTRASYEEGAENWGAADNAFVPPPPPPPPPRPAMNEEEQEESQQEEWEVEDLDDEDEGLIIGHENRETERRQPWVLQVEIPESATDGDGDNSGSANVFIDPGMTSERLGRCIIQAVSPTSAHSWDYNDEFTSSHRSNLAGLFGKDDRVFYSLEFILAMDPLDSANRIFCVTKPIRHKVPTAGQSDNTNWSSISTYMTFDNLLVAAAVLFVAIVIGPTTLIYSIVLLVPQDLPSAWRIVSYVLDWPAREIYRYGPSIVGWEGRDLIDICTQMNRRYYFVGLGRDGHNYEDREYWRQNPEACETIYRMKEESFARMCRPVWYLIVLVAGFYAVQRVVQKFFAKSSGPPLNRVDRAVLDMYRALQILSKEHQRQDDRWQQQQQQRTAKRR